LHVCHNQAPSRWIRIPVLVLDSQRRAFSDRTVRKHLDNIYAMLGVRSRAQAVAVTAGLG